MPFPRGPCGEIHPFPFARFGSELQHRCEGTIHVTTPLSGPEAAEATQAVYERLLADLAQSPLRRLVLQARPVFVYVFPSVHDCAHYLNRGRPEGGAIAGYHPALSRVFVGWDDYDDYTSEFEDVLRHELVHHLHDGRSPHSPLWLSEGLAEAYGESHPRALAARPLALDLEGLLSWGKERLDVARAVDRYFQTTVLVRGLLRDERTRETFVRYALDPWPIHELDELAGLLGLEERELYELFVQEFAASQDARVAREREQAAPGGASEAEPAGPEEPADEVSATVVLSGPAPGAAAAPEARPEAAATELTAGAFAFLLLVLFGLGGLGLALSRRGPAQPGLAPPAA